MKGPQAKVGAVARGPRKQSANGVTGPPWSEAGRWRGFSPRLPPRFPALRPLVIGPIGKSYPTENSPLLHVGVVCHCDTTTPPMEYSFPWTVHPLEPSGWAARER